MEMINSALMVSESETILATQNSNVASVSSSTACEATGCPPSRTISRSSLEPTIPVSTLQPVCISLNSTLSQLLVSIQCRMKFFS